MLKARGESDLLDTFDQEYFEAIQAKRSNDVVMTNSSLFLTGREKLYNLGLWLAFSLDKQEKH